jgi:hypothetical protein
VKGGVACFIQVTINPRALSIERLYGQVDVTSREWTDGVLSAEMRTAAATATAQGAAAVGRRHWVSLSTY